MAKTLVYEMWPIACPGGFGQMTEHLERVKALGCDYVWLAPVYPSPRFDHGYDITDYCSIDSRFGTNAEFRALVDRAHELGMGVLMDMVLNHTSTYHSWFRHKPEYYCLKEDVSMYSGWRNLFSSGSAWTWDDGHDKYYCHLFHQRQADLNWFPDPDGKKINTALVKEFREIVKFWMDEYGVDGFRLDVPQSINKDFGQKSLEFSDLLRGEKSVNVINAIFTGEGAPTTRDGKKPFLMMELLDPTYGEIVDFYTERTPVVDFYLNILIKDLADGNDKNELATRVLESCKRPKFMMDLESHDSPRIASRKHAHEWEMDTHLPPAEFGAMMLTFGNPQGICIYQGQELGLPNPTREELPDAMMAELDAQTKMRHYLDGASFDELRPTSRANARVPIPLQEYWDQEFKSEFQMTPLKFFKEVLRLWREGLAYNKET